MTALIIIGVYLVGYIGAFLIIYFQNYDDPLEFESPKNWASADTVATLIVSLMSWAIVISWAISCIRYKTDKLTKQ